MSGASPDPRELAALLDWYVENGVDLALDDAPHDRYADSARAPAAVERAREAPAAPLRAAPGSPPGPPALTPQNSRQAPASRREVAPVAPDEAARAAQAQAAAAGNLEELAARLAAFEHAPFREMARHCLFAAGAGADAPLMIVEVAPGEEEEATGAPFCGAQARLLDNMLAAIGFERSRARLAYLSPWRPPGRATLTPQQIAIFAPFARRHVELARPRALLLFGEASARALLTSSETMNKLRGRAHEAQCGGYAAPAFVLPGLDGMLNSWALKPAAWRDLRAAASHLAQA